MKKLCMVATLLVMSACTQTKQHEGMSAYTRRTFESLQHTGNLALDEVKVTGELSGSGELTAKKSRFGSLTWKGPVKLDESSVLGTTTINGDKVELKETKINGNLEVRGTDKGQTTLDQVTVENQVIGNGTLHLTKGRIGGFDWKGATTITECHVGKQANFTGPLSLETCTFSGSIIATSTMVHLNAVEVNGNLLIPETGQNEAQTVVLTGGSIIKGNITFASGQGIVKKEGDSKIEGKVIGTEY